MNNKKKADLRTGERLRLCLEGGRRLGGLLRLGEIRLLGLLRRGENDLEKTLAHPPVQSHLQVS